MYTSGASLPSPSCFLRVFVVVGVVCFIFLRGWYFETFVFFPRINKCGVVLMAKSHTGDSAAVEESG